jgi:hypothetical protein
MGERSLDLAWSEMFEAFDLAEKIDKDGFVDVTAKQFHQLNFEPRKNTKIDHQVLLPKIFQDHGYGILTRGIDTWRIGSFEIFQPLPKWTLPGKNVKDMSLPSFIETIDPYDITGEQGSINAAYASGIIEDFLGQEQVLTVAGRMRTPDFEFNVNNKVSGTSLIKVSKAQIEIDAGFEGVLLAGASKERSAFTILEAKNHVSPDFVTRQLFYPVATWTDWLPGKPIRAVFMTFANEVYDLFEYSFDPKDYSSASLTQHRRYSIGLRKPKRLEILVLAREIASAGKFTLPQGIPFPQADNFEMVMDFFAFIAEEPRTKEALGVEYPLSSRQSDEYYPDACEYLGLIEDGTNELGLRVRQVTKLGRSVMKMDYKKRVLKLAELMLRIPPILETYLEFQETGELASVDTITHRFDGSSHAVTSKGAPLTGTTPRRRARTIRSWVKWLDSVVE